MPEQAQQLSPGQKVELIFVEPLGNEEVFGNQTIPATIVSLGQRARQGSRALLIKTDQQYMYKGIDCQYFIAISRALQSAGIDQELLVKGEAFCAFFRISESLATGPVPFESNLAEAGHLGFLGHVYLAGAEGYFFR